MRPYLRQLSWATLIVNIAIIVTGGAVRLTGSGLGCPTWPECQPGSLVPHGAISINKAIEFSNRMVTPLITVVVVLTLIAAWCTAERRWVWWIVGGVAAQAIIGGITVRIKLNPWLVSAHLIVSAAMVVASVALILASHHRKGRPDVLGWAQFAVTSLVIVLGTIVTGAGPHAGDVHVKRNGLSPLQTAQLHADAVMLLCGLAIALVVLRRTRATYALIATLVLNAAIGFTQYFTHLPVALVAAHMLGAALVVAASAWVLLEPTPGRAPGEMVGRSITGAAVPADSPTG